MLRIVRSSDRPEVERLFRRRGQRLEEAERSVAPILEAVRQRGADALIEYGRRFDGLEDRELLVPQAELERAAEGLAPEFRRAVETATSQIRAYARLQMPRSWTETVGEGVRLGQIIRPLDTVGAYVPGGRYPLPSTLMMTVAPAHEAGVRTVVVTSPKPSAETLGTAGLLGVQRFLRLGGAQAIAALAFGVEPAPKAQRVVGPGNIYVAAAKKLLAGETGIDFLAGPTEILLIALEGDAELLAADMLAQAEHDVDAAAILLTTSEELARQTAEEVERQLASLPTAAVACEAIRNNSAVVVVESADEASDLANRFAPEHLSVPDRSWLDRVENAGSVFVGRWSPEAAGDYVAGPNHVLPTGGAATLRGGLSILDYVKIISVQELDPTGLARLAPAAVTLARAEGLEAHARSIEVRIRD